MTVKTATGKATDKAGHSVSPVATFEVIDPVQVQAMLVGGSHDDGTGNKPEPFEQKMGLTAGQQLDLFRCYESGGPPLNWSGSSFRQHFGNRPMWWSCKGDINGWANPNSVEITNAKNLARTYNPSWPQMYWTIWHEVQPKLVNKEFTFAQFRAAWNMFYAQVRPIAPPNVRLMVIHGGFGWRPGSDQTTIPSSQNEYCASPAEWRTLPVDMYGVDAYGGPQVEDIIEMARVQRFVNEMAGGDLSKVAIAESSCRQSSLLKQAGGDPAKADVLGQQWVRRVGREFATGTNSDGVKIWDGKSLNAWCLWNSQKTVDPGLLTLAQCETFGDVWRDQHLIAA